MNRAGDWSHFINSLYFKSNYFYPYVYEQGSGSRNEKRWDMPKNQLKDARAFGDSDNVHKSV